MGSRVALAFKDDLPAWADQNASRIPAQIAPAAPVSNVSRWASWMEPSVSEDDASSEDFPDFNQGRARIGSGIGHEDESSEDLTTLRQRVTALSPLLGEEGFDLNRPLEAEFCLPAAISGVKSTVDKNLIFCEPAADIQVYFKNNHTLVIAPLHGRWKGSTSYSVQVSNSIIFKLEDAVLFNFHTLALKMQMFTRILREDPLKPIFKLVPNQEIDVQKVLSGLSLTTRPIGMAGYLMSSVTRFQRSTHTVKVLAVGKDFLEVVPNGPLPPNSVAELLLSPGSYSMEGPNPCKDSFSVEVSTYPPLSVVSRFPSYFHKVTPGEPWRINFSNDLQLDQTQLQSLVEIKPSVPFVVTTSFDSRLSIIPDTEAFTTYTVTLSSSISDVFGQELGASDSFVVTTGQWPKFEGVLKGEKGLVTHYGTSRRYKYHHSNVPCVRERVFLLSGDSFFVMGSHDLVHRKSVLSSPEDPLVWIPKNGKCLYDKKKTFAPQASGWEYVDWDAFLSGFGRIALLIEPAEELLPRIEGGGMDPRALSLYCIVQSTSVSIASLALPSMVLVLVSRLSDGSPVADAVVREADGGGKLGLTNKDGWLTVPRLPDKRLLAIAPDNPEDVCFFLASKWAHPHPPHALCGFALEKSVFAPGDVVHVKLWARVRPPPAKGILSKFPAGEILSWNCLKVEDSDRDSESEEMVTLMSGATVFNMFSSATILFDIPKDVSAGTYTIYFRSDIEAWNERDCLIGSCSFQVEPSAAVAFACSVSVAKPANVGVQGENRMAVAVVTADRVKGGYVTGAQVKWTAKARAAPLQIPLETYPGFLFGDHTLLHAPQPMEAKSESLYSELNNAGFSRATLSWSGSDVFQRPVEVEVTASVQDSLLQTHIAKSTFTLPPSGDALIGLSLNRTWILQGERVEVSVVTLSAASCDPVKEKVALSLFHGGLVEDAKELHQAGHVFFPKNHGWYRVDARVGCSRTTVPVYVAPAQSLQKVVASDRRNVALVLNRKKQDKGEVAEDIEVLVVCLELPFAFGALVATASGVLMTKRFQLSEMGTAMLSLQIPRSWYPGCKLRVILMGQAGGIPAWARGEADVHLSLNPHQLKVSSNLNAVMEIQALGDKQFSWQVRSVDEKVEEDADLFVLGGPASMSPRIPAFSSLFFGIVETAGNSFEHMEEQLLLDVVVQEIPESLSSQLKAWPQKPPTVEKLKGEPAWEGRSSGERSRAVLDMRPEEDRRDKLSIVEESSSVFEDVESGEDEQLEELLFDPLSVGIVVACVESRGHPMIFSSSHSRDGPYISLVTKVVRGVTELGRRANRDEHSEFQVVMHRIALNCVVACLASKSLPLRVAFGLLDELVDIVASNQVLDPKSLRAKVSFWNSEWKKEKENADAAKDQSKSNPSSDSSAVVLASSGAGAPNAVESSDSSSTKARNNSSNNNNNNNNNSNISDTNKKSTNNHHSVTDVKLENRARISMSNDEIWIQDLSVSSFFGIAQEQLVPKQAAGEGDPFLLFGPQTSRREGGVHVIDVPRGLKSGMTYSFVAIASTKEKFGLCKSMLKLRDGVELAILCPSTVNIGDSFVVRIVLDLFEFSKSLKLSVESSNVAVLSSSCASFELEFEDGKTRGEMVVPMDARGCPFDEQSVTLKISVETEQGKRAEKEARVTVLWPMRGEVSSVHRTVGFGSFVSKDVLIPLDLPETGAGSGLRVDCSQSQVLFLGPAVHEMWMCRSNHLEVLSSRLLGLCATFHQCQALGPGSNSSDEVVAKLHQDVTLLLELQGALGGFGVWSRNSASSAFLSIHAAHALWEVNQLQTRIQISAASLDRCRAFVDSASRAPVTCIKDVRTRAYASYVGAKMGACIVSAAQAKFVAKEADHWDLATLGWLLGAVCLSLKLLDIPKKKGRFSSLWGMFSADTAAKERSEALEVIVGLLLDLLDSVPVAEHAGVAAASDRHLMDHDFLFSETRGLSVAFEGLQRFLEEANSSGPKASKPTSKKMDELASRILARRGTDGTWGSIHDNCFSVISLARFFSSALVGEPAELEVVSGEKVVATAGGKDRSCHVCLSGEELRDLALRSDGGFFCVSLDRMPGNRGRMHAIRSGFGLRRVLEPVDKEGDVEYNEAEQQYRVKLGCRVRIRLTVVPDYETSFQVLLRDRLAGCFEIVNPRFVGCISPDEKWHDFLNVKSSWVDVFADKLIGRTERTFSYIVWAVSRGLFLCPPADVKEMYTPTMFGRSRSATVEVVE